MKTIQIIKHPYRKFTIIEYKDLSCNVSTYKVAYGLLKTKPVNTLHDAMRVVDVCYQRAEAKKRAKRCKK